jgi:hypothetical protein
MIRSLLSRVNNTLEPPSPELRENPLESGGPALGSSRDKPHSSPGPPAIPSVDIPDQKPTSDNPASSQGHRRTVGEWFSKVMTKRSRNQAPRQTPSEAPPESFIPSHTEATSPNEKPSTMSPGRRQKVSALFSVDAGHGYLTTRLSGRLEGPLSNQRLVHASCPYEQLLTVTHRRKQLNSLRRVNRPRPLRTQKLVPPTSRMK